MSYFPIYQRLWTLSRFSLFNKECGARILMEKIRIIIAEDTKGTRRFYDTVLSDSFYEKRFAQNGKEALELYESWNAEILILDMMMPLVSGYVVLKTIRSQKDVKSQRISIVMATSNGTEHDVRNCLPFDIQGYIVKPFNIKEIENQILTAFSKKSPLRVIDLNECRDSTALITPKGELL